MRVKRLSEILGVTVDTVRYYTRIGYLNPGKNSANGYKDYEEKDLKRLRFILSARQLGFSVEDVGKIIGVAEKGESPCPLVRRLLDQRLHQTEKQFLQTVTLRKRMQEAITEWENKPDNIPDGHMVCQLIEDFMDND
tara:strand:- start:209 stop:619 length:411 start_codon:yes stop_codon:yes gene_type:complete